MNKINFDMYFRGFHFVDCAIRDRNSIYLLSRKEYEVAEGDSDPDESEVIKRLVNIFLDEPEEDRYGHSELTGFRTINIEVSKVPKPHAVAVDYKAQVCARGSGLTGIENPSPLGRRKKVRNAAASAN